MLILSMATTMTAVGANPQPTKLFVDPQTYTATQLGEVFTININIANVHNLTGVAFKLGYNTTLLDALEAVEGPFLQPFTMRLVDIKDSEGYIWVSIMGPMNTGNGTVAIITFKATYAESASCALHLYDTQLLDNKADFIDHEVEDGEYEFVILGIIGITVTTDKPFYNPEENVTIYGNLTQDESPIQGLVALEVDNPNNYPIVARTLQTGPTPPPGNITVVEVFPSTSIGDPKNNFSRGSTAFFTTTIRNDGSELKYVQRTINVYDVNRVPLHGVQSTLVPINPGVNLTWITSFPIPTWAAIGNGSVYAGAYTNWPRVSGVPYCPEKNATFEITGGGQGAGSSGAQSSGNNLGNYSLTFKLANIANTSTPGIYRVYVSSSSQGQALTDNTVFGVNATYVCPSHYLTIQEAVDAATPTNNSILVCLGTYNEHVTINKSVTLVGREPSKTIINGTGIGTVVTVTANNVEISSFTIKNSGGSFPDSGIALNNSSNSIISENTILNNYCGVYLTNSSQENTIQENTITLSNGYGINIHSSQNNDILDNTLSNNNHGIYINQSISTTLRNNNLVDNNFNFGIFGDSLQEFTHNIDTSNTVDGKPIIYWINQQDRVVPSNAGFVAIVSSTNITVRELNLTKNGQGVLFAFASDSVIERVNTINNEYGIYLDNSYSNTIIGSEVANNTVGIHQRYCNNNTICHNNFINNTQQVYNYSSTNTWDDGAGKGNYWSDYTGVDDGSGNRTAGDGVGDTLLPHQGVDWYPLMNLGLLVHDVAVISVTYTTLWPYPQVYPTWKTTITVTVKNEGDFTESFNITAYYNGNPIEMKAITEMTPQTETTKNLTWIPTGVPPGNYTISAEASELFNETDTADNVFIDGQVEIMLWGDVNGNGVAGPLDFGDVGKMYLIYSLFITDPEIVWRGDINGNGVVGPLDFADVALMYLIYTGTI